MRSAATILNEQYLEMRWRCLSLAADFDRIERAEGGAELLRSDERLKGLRDALRFTIDSTVNARRAEFLQQLLSDRSTEPAPSAPSPGKRS